MDLTILAIAIFIVSTMLILGVLYFLIAAPAADRTLRTRLEAIQNAAYTHYADDETELLRQEVLSKLPAMHRLLVQFPPAVRLSLFLQQAGIEMNVGKLLSLMLLIFIGVCTLGLLSGIHLLWIPVLAAACGAIPLLVIAIKRRNRFSKFEEQFPDAIDLLARAVRAGHAFTTGLELIGTEMPEPVAGEFRRTFDQQNLGMPLREALENLLVRMPVPDMHVFVTALIIQREAGGNLAEILDNLSQVIRERFKLMRQVRVFTAQGRMSLIVLTAMPPIVGLGMFAMNREYILRLFTDALGQKMLATAVLLQILGYIVIARIIKPKI